MKNDSGPCKRIMLYFKMRINVHNVQLQIGFSISLQNLPRHTITWHSHLIKTTEFNFDKIDLLLSTTVHELENNVPSKQEYYLVILN